MQVATHTSASSTTKRKAKLQKCLTEALSSLYRRLQEGSEAFGKGHGWTVGIVAPKAPNCELKPHRQVGKRTVPRGTLVGTVHACCEVAASRAGRGGGRRAGGESRAISGDNNKALLAAFFATMSVPKPTVKEPTAPPTSK